MGPTCLMCFLSSPMSARWYSIGQTADGTHLSDVFLELSHVGPLVLDRTNS